MPPLNSFFVASRLADVKLAQDVGAADDVADAEVDDRPCSGDEKTSNKVAKETKRILVADLSQDDLVIVGTF